MKKYTTVNVIVRVDLEYNSEQFEDYENKEEMEQHILNNLKFEAKYSQSKYSSIKDIEIQDVVNCGKST
jgi:hypothetical protein